MTEMDLSKVVWTPTTYQAFLATMRAMGDETLQAHMARLVPTTYPIWGLTMAQLKQLGQEIGRGDPAGFLAVADATSYEAVIVQGFVISRMKLDCAAFTQRCDAYLALADCWSMCDLVVHCRQVLKFKPAFLPVINRYLKSDNPWLQRTGLVFLLKFYLAPAEVTQTLTLATNVTSTDYYVQMGQAWLLKAAFPQNQAAVYRVLRERLPLAVVQKTVTKLKGLRHTTSAEKTELIAILTARRQAEG